MGATEGHSWLQYVGSLQYRYHYYGNGVRILVASGSSGWDRECGSFLSNCDNNTSIDGPSMGSQTIIGIVQLHGA